MPWGVQYFLTVNARDLEPDGYHVYYGDYTVRVADITHIQWAAGNSGARHTSSTASNEYETQYLGIGNQADPGFPYLRAQKFTIGTNSGGYSLKWVDTHVFNRDDASRPAASLHPNSSSCETGTAECPGVKVFDFETPPGFKDRGAKFSMGEDRFTAPAAAAALPASTHYWIVFHDNGATIDSADINHYDLPYVNVSADSRYGPAGGRSTLTGWSIGDRVTQATIDTAGDQSAWHNIPANPSAIKIDIYATPVGGS